MEQLLSFLHQVHPLSPALFERLQKIVRHREISRKYFLLKSGQRCRYIYFISKGLLRAFYVKEHVEVSSWFMKENDICVSIESFYQQKQSEEYIQAIEDCVLFYIEYEELEKLYKEFPEFNFIGRVLTIKYLQLWAQQIYGIRMKTARERYLWLLDFHPELLLRVPHKYISSYLDITPETFSKMRGIRIKDTTDH